MLDVDNRARVTIDLEAVAMKKLTKRRRKLQMETPAHPILFHHI